MTRRAFLPASLVAFLLVSLALQAFRATLREPPGGEAVAPRDSSAVPVHPLAACCETHEEDGAGGPARSPGGGQENCLPLAPGEASLVVSACEVPEGEGEIEGRVLDAEGLPVPDIEVEARPLDFGSKGAAFAAEASPGLVRTGPDGSFRCEGLPLLEHVLTTRETPRYLSARATIQAGSSEPVDLVLETRRTMFIHGTIRDGRGSPVAAAQVSSPTLSGPPAATGPDGGYLLEVACERNSVSLSAHKEGYARAERRLPPSEVEGREEAEVDLLLEPLGEVGEVNGKITSAADGSPLAGQVVCLHSVSLNATSQFRSDEDGTYVLSGVRPAADYRIWVHPDRSFRDYQRFPVSIGPVTMGAGTLRFDIALEPLETARIRGRLFDPQGLPLPRLTLWVRSQAATGNLVPITGDEQGRFGPQEVPAGELVIESRAAPWISVRGVRVETGEEREVEVPVGLGRGSLAGRVTDSLSRPVPGSRLTLTWSRTHGAVQTAVYREAVSDDEGRFLFWGLAPGQAVLRATARGFSDHPLRWHLTGGDEEARIELAAAPAARG